MNLFNAINTLQNGKVIAYPTEAVYGLGCDPYNNEAIKHVLTLKRRSWQKGLILIASDWNQVASLTEPIPQTRMSEVLATWPGPITWVFPAKAEVSQWIKGTHNTLAVRVTSHPIARALCEGFAKPIISTSANIEGQEPARTKEQVELIFGEGIDLIIPGAVGDLRKPTEIRDALSGEIIRGK